MILSSGDESKIDKTISEIKGCNVDLTHEGDVDLLLDIQIGTEDDGSNVIS